MHEVTFYKFGLHKSVERAIAKLVRKQPVASTTVYRVIREENRLNIHIHTFVLDVAAQPSSLFNTVLFIIMVRSLGLNSVKRANEGDTAVRDGRCF